MPQYGLYVHAVQSGWVSRFDASDSARTVGWVMRSRYELVSTWPISKKGSPICATMRPSSLVKIFPS